MIEFKLFETAEEAGSALLQWLEQPDRYTKLCTDKDGLDTAFLPRRSVEKIACFVPNGGFFSRESCEQLLQEFILAKADKIAEFLSRGGPLRSLSLHCTQAVGYWLELQENGNMTESLCFDLHMILSKQKCGNRQYRFSISSFSPIITKEKGESL